MKLSVKFKPYTELFMRCLILMAVVMTTGCGSLSTQPLSIPNTYGITQARERIAATGDASECNQPVDPAQLPPAELSKMSLPTYRIEPPDILVIDAIRLVPKSPYYIQSLDILQIVVAGSLPEQPIAGQYQVEASGIVNLGPSYGPVKLEGLTTEEASDAIARQLRGVLTEPEVAVTLLQASGLQQIAGEHLVGPDGTINLGVYGSVYAAGLTIEQTRAAVECKLAEDFDAPKVSIDVFAYNSKVYYIIIEGPGASDQVVRVQVTGNETVLDAISNIGGLSQLSSSKIWISRPAPHGVGCDQVLPVDWDAITRGANTATNYQLLPGDRIFVAADRLVALDSFIGRITTPFERILGFTLLGGQSIQVLQRFPEGRFF
ncbi:MAG: polysaccharide biosynthesis/export family protein [Planctomycetota bacterium]